MSLCAHMHTHTQQVLIRYRHYLEAEVHLKMEAQRHGVPAERLLFLQEGSHKVSVCVYETHTHTLSLSLCLSLSLSLC